MREIKSLKPSHLTNLWGSVGNAKKKALHLHSHASSQCIPSFFFFVFLSTQISNLQINKVLKGKNIYKLNAF